MSLAIVLSCHVTHYTSALFTVGDFLSLPESTITHYSKSAHTTQPMPIEIEWSALCKIYVTPFTIIHSLRFKSQQLDRHPLRWNKSQVTPHMTGHNVVTGIMMELPAKSVNLQYCAPPNYYYPYIIAAHGPIRDTFPDPLCPPCATIRPWHMT